MYPGIEPLNLAAGMNSADVSPLHLPSIISLESRTALDLLLLGDKTVGIRARLWKIIITTPHSLVGRADEDGDSD